MNKKRIMQAIQRENNIQEEKRHALKTLIVSVITGIIFMVFSAGMFFGYCRPFVDWVEVNCKVKGKDFYKSGNWKVTAIYYVDGIKYEYTTSYGARYGGGGPSGVSFYYNADDPTDTVSGSREALIYILPCVFGVGIFMVSFGAVFYKKSKKVRKKR